MTYNFRVKQTSWVTLLKVLWWTMKLDADRVRSAPEVVHTVHRVKPSAAV